MTRKIFWSIFFSAIAALILSAVLNFGALYNYFSSLTMRQLENQTELAAQGVETDGRDYLNGLKAEGYRITWINSDGMVLYESSKTNAADMENHLEREEVQEAFASGSGESKRYSSTIMENSYYVAKLLTDGTVLRLSVTQHSVIGILLGIIQPILIVFAFAILFSLFLAYRFSRNVVKPLNHIDLDHPEEVEGYDELSPLLSRINNQQKQLEIRADELTRKEDELETILENMNEGMILLNSEGRIISLNTAAAQILEVDHVMPGSSILVVSRNMSFQNAVQDGLNGRHMEEIIPFGSGQYQLTVSPVVKKDEVKGAVAALFDITERVQAEEMRKEFSANVSHELKTPLHAISGYAELMKNGMVQQKDIQPFAEKIYNEAQRTIQLVEDIISLSHLDEGADDMQFEDVDLHNIAQNVLDTLQKEAEKSGIVLTLTGEETHMQGSVTLLQEIVQNLCENSIKYNHPGGCVTVNTVTDGPNAILTVSDNGIGIPETDQKRIFERFYRVDKSHSRAIGGTGLGLSIVKHAVMIHHGSIELKSKAGEGTVITIRFPANI